MPPMKKPSQPKVSDTSAQPVAPSGANAIEDHDHPRVDLVEISTTKYFANDEWKHCRGTCVGKSIEKATAEHGPDACFAKQLGKPPHHA